MTRTYSECISYLTYRERFEYLKLEGTVGEETFGRARSLNQELYRSAEWLKARDRAIIRDSGCDLAMPGYEIRRYLIVHHINPVTEEQIRKVDPCLFDLENLICVHRRTHNAIHYGDFSLIDAPPVRERKPFDTCPWKGGSNG